MSYFAPLVRKVATTHATKPAAAPASRRFAIQPLSAKPLRSPACPGPAPENRTLRAVAAFGMTGPVGNLPHLARIQTSFGPGHDLSGVRAHVGGSAAVAAQGMGAMAFTMGEQVAFRKPPDLFTAAHEAAHVVQQRAGLPLDGVPGRPALEQSADRVAERVVRDTSSEDLFPGVSSGSSLAGMVQMRRLPADTEALLVDPSNPSVPPPNFDANSEGLMLLLQRAVAEMKTDEIVQAVKTMLGGLSWWEFVKLPQGLMLVRASNAIQSIRPDLTLGDPKLIDTGPRSGTADAANLQKLVTNANAVFDKIASGSVDSDLTDIFGKKNVAQAKAKCANARRWVIRLQRRNKIVTDRSGYSTEVDLGGLTGFHEQIALSPDNIDSPDDNESILTLIHEAMHAGNADVDDKGYVGQPSFTELAADVKLTNAAHFEIVPRRIQGADFAYTGQTFVPAGTTVGGVTTPPMTDKEKAIRGASETFREAWTAGLNLHSLFVDAYKNPRGWKTDRGGSRTYAKGLPYWSKVEKLTIHRKTVILPTSSNPAERPVSEIDVALSEGLVRKVAQSMNAVPADEAACDAFEQANSDPAERAAALGTVTSHRDFLTKLVLKQPTIAPITGTVDRDQRMTKELAHLSSHWGDVLKRRNPDDFSD